MLIGLSRILMRFWTITVRGLLHHPKPIKPRVALGTLGDRLRASGAFSSGFPGRFETTQLAAFGLLETR